MGIHWNLCIVLLATSLCWRANAQTCTQGDVRLVNGATTNEGRVELCNNNVWGTVCDDLWGVADAQVVCRQLGFSTTGATALSRATFGQGTGQIWLDNVNCAGTETRLISCPANALGSHNCAHSEDAGVRCAGSTTCTQGAIRLQGGTSTSGRVEICNNNVWGTVCDDFWGTADAQVACRQLGFSATGAVAITSGFTNGVGQIWLDNVQCAGTETRLIDCPANALGSHNCGHVEDAGVRCTASVCTQGAIRLQGGTSNSGRVEICNNNVWGTVCDDFWGTADAQVACRQLGFSTTGAVAITTGFTNGVGQIWLDNVQCTGSETRLIDCPANALGSHNCAHIEDAGVTCQAGTVCTQGAIRLQGGANSMTGRVEICNNNVWGTVCDDLWGTPDAMVACRQLGFSATGAVAITTGFTNGAGQIWLDNVQCGGTETRLIDCTANPLGSHNCVHAEDAGVTCTGTAGCTQGDIRLQGGANNMTGRVEVCNSNEWGTVCDDSWGAADAQVVCRQLGFTPTGAVALTTGFTNGAGRIWLDDVQCTGTETRLLSCPSSPIGTHNCAHIEDAGVRCQAGSQCTQGDIRLQGGTSTSGRVEICNNNVWGTVCDDFWGTPDAQVACRQLGFSTTGAVALTTGFTNGVGQIWLDNVQCTGTEARLIDCTANALGSHNCVHAEDAGVRCQTAVLCTQGDIRLQGGANSMTGRVEICNNNAWGTVCDDLWGASDAQVACRQLGFSDIGAVAITTGFTNGAGQIWLDNVQCAGTETRLIDCPANALGSHNCAHVEDAGVTCQAATCTQGAIRLQGGTSNRGRVEICNNNVWGTVCDDAWGTPDAQVACRQLGFSATGATAITLGNVPDGTGQIWLDNVNCAGTETRLIDCPANPLGNHNCVHAEDAGVDCPAGCTQGDIRLQGGANSMTGRVEICNNNVWGTVCDDFWGTADAQVVCRQLGFTPIGAVAITSGFTNGVGQIWLDNVQCVGTETRLISCPANPLGNHNCAHVEDAGVTCQAGTTPPPVCSQGSIRLVGGTNQLEGRVEFCNNNVWGTVCDDLWGTPDANVVCRQLGFSPTGATALSFAFFGQGTGQIWLDNVQCVGTEAMLSACPANAIGSHNCAHSEDASVRCQAITACTNRDIRLVGGTNQYEGRVEYCNNGVWGTVCDDAWGTPDATVVCRQLGYSTTGATALSVAFFGQGTGQIWLDNVNCVGTETMLFACPANAIGSHNCVHAEDASVRCQPPTTTVTPEIEPYQCTQGDVRLVGGPNPLQGRVEICYYNQWGTVCDDSWSTNDARVVCGQLGYSNTAATAVSFAAFGSGSGPIVLDDVVCTGTESRLIDCRASLTHNCAHSEDAGVRCTISTSGCTTGAIRLAGTGSNSTQGRVEVCNNNLWGTVCDDLWGNIDATVACRQLGYSSLFATGPQRAPFGQGTGPILLDNVQCAGTEARLFDCTANAVGSHNCAHSEDAGAVCTAVCEDGALRLAAGNTGATGRVEICYNGVWGTVCDDFFSNVDAQVVCNQLGFVTTGATALTTVPAGTGMIYLDNVGCTGSETTLHSCPNSGIGTHNCVHSEDVGVSCNIPACVQGAVRLVGGTTSTEGRVEFCNNGIWGTVCDDLWGVADAQVVCRQLGFVTTSVQAVGQAGFGQGTGQIWLDNVNCAGTEGRLADCAANAIGAHNCVHSEDAGVRCGITCTQGDVRLVGGTNALEGRVEVCNNNAWGTVCDDFWGTADASVVCRQLGYNATGATAFSRAQFGQGTGPIVLDDVQCTGSELTLVSCTARPIGTHNCAHSEDAGVRCQPATPTCTTGDIRLVGGTNSSEGRVEVCNNNAWGTVCDDLWDATDAMVACRQAGFSATGAVAVSRAGFGQGTGAILLDNLGCTGSEARLWDCTNNGVGIHNCAHSEDAGVRCQLAPSTCVNGDIRLVGGTNQREGRVEICNNNAWGTVCDDSWSTFDAQVTCRQLGFSQTGATAVSNAGFGQGTGPILLDDLRCTSTENRLLDCPSSGIGVHNCVHAEDAGVRCVTSTTPCTNGDVRLIGGSTSFQGRVEVCNNNNWGTVCDDGWGVNDARVVCRQLGYTGTGTVEARSNAAFGQGTGAIVYDDVGCIGTEGRLSDCSNTMDHNCVHGEDAGVVCPSTQTCTQGDLRLVGGTSSTDGRLEICNNNVWGTVCDDLFTNVSASVACRQLGFLSTGAVALTTGFTNGVGQIWLDNVQCAGTETRLIDCPANALGSHNCAHFEDVGVRCQPMVTTPPDCTTGDIRLVSGANEFQGRVEICNNAVWGTVCDDLWGTPDANVVCRQLGYRETGATAVSFAGFGQGTGQIWLDNVACVGSERRLIDCPANPLGSHNCAHSEDAGVICLPPVTVPPICTQGDVRLVGGSNAREGRVEVCNNNAWGTVCDDSFGGTDAGVVCRQLGYSSTGAMARCCAAFGQGTGQIVLDDVGCTGTETSIFACPNRGINSHNCAHSEDVGVVCSVVCNNGDIRLVNGNSSREGRVEICNNQAWGTVCDDLWDNTDAMVACVQLGYQGTGATAFSRAFFGQGTGNILLDNVQCTGTESRLVDCPNNGLGIHNCIHSEDAGLRCIAPCNTGDIRLIGGSSVFEGRVEICNNGVWGTVCDDAWGTPDATVVCRQLGYSTTGAIARGVAFFGQGSGPITLDNVNCAGTETRLIDCPANALGVHNCVHGEDAGVTCQTDGTTPTPVCTDWDLRLVGGANATQGRVEVCFSGIWGTICDDFWDSTDAGVICGQLGYSREGATAQLRAAYGQGTGPIHIDDVRCTGSENALQSCPLSRTHNCVHAEDAGVNCLICAQGDIRLVGGTQLYEGRVEVCDNQEWGTVCDDAWGTPDANVACRQAGFSRFGATALSFANFGQGSGPIILDNVGCTGNEATLFDCPNNGIRIHNCVHSEDASVRCLQDLRCNQGAARLIGGTTSNVGRVEVCINETWGTVCDDLWGSADAGIICAQLGFSRYNATARGQAFYGQGTGSIVLDNVDCAGTETNILQCPFDPDTTDCRHSEDAGVDCVVDLLCSNGDIRLVSGTTMYEGRVELCNNEVWGTVCDDSWGTPDAQVVCRQLGFGTDGAQAFLFARFGQGTGPILLDDVACAGTETRLVDCPSSPLGIHNCVHFEDASVSCPAPPTPCSSGDVRLVGGTVDSEGRVEFCQSGTWGTVCDDFWGVADAQVVCRQLGYATVNATAYSFARFGQGTGPIYLDNVQCAGTELTLGACTANPIGTHNCAHTEDAGVGCQVCVNGDLRLVGGQSETEGRVELCVNSAWGTVCDDLWDNNDAMVVCRQAGFTGGIARSRAFFGQGEGTIVLDDVQCVGTEARLTDCPSTSQHNCAHSEDAGVTCTALVCQTGDVRLVNGTTTEQGRVEICMNGVWGTVCDDQWDNLDASVVCRQLNFSRFHSEAFTNARFGQGTGMIFLDDVACSGNEARLIDCTYTSTHNCQHSEDAAVGCRAELLCNDTDIRVVGGSTQYEGRVELCFDETWGTICDGGWSSVDARVACRQLGYAITGATAFNNAFFGQGAGPIYYDDFTCTGNEISLLQCGNGGFNTTDFCNGHADDAGVRCAENCTNGALRLVNGQNTNEGRVEICVNGQWGTVCDDFWDSTDAQVVCRQLGYSPTGAQSFSFAFFGQGTGPIHLDDVRCTGSELTLLSCTHTQIDNCAHFEDAGVRCQGCATGDVRLVGGSGANEGRVEICRNSAWGTVCDDSWGTPDATVVCRQLGFSAIGAIARSRAFFGQGTGMIFLDDVACAGTEGRLVDCTANTQHNCAHSEDAGVTCVAAPVCNPGQVRLVGGTTRFEGRVEVCVNETWGTVCDDSWDNNDAGVVCGQLGFSRFNAVGSGMAAFGQGSGPIFVDNSACTGTEVRLLTCQYDSDASDCTHAEDASVTCSGTLICADGELRLAGGTSELEGRLEICFNETWGTICDGFWSTSDANVACRQLGFQPSGATPLYNAAFGPGTGPVWLDDLLCNGRESRIVDCPNGGVGNIDFCNGHNDDAGVRCIEGCVNGQVRLIGGRSPTEGRVEVCVDQQWGTVCDDFWDSNDASVVCTQLGYSRINATAYSNARFGQGAGLIHLDNVACIGMEPNLTSCTYDADTSDCSHAEDASVSCVAELVCNNGDLRLNGSTNPTQGRVEICINETWGTVCDDSWDNNDAMVACRALGLSQFGATAVQQAFFGQGTGPIFLDDVGCLGNETSLLNCANTMVHNCGHSEDAGVRCGGAPICQDGDIRLVNGPAGTNSSGRVEVCRNEVWGTVCDDAWAQEDANVACRQLGYSRYGAVARSNAFYGQGSGPINLDDVACTGSESRLFDCPFSPTHNCGHNEDAGVDCVAERTCQEGDVRLQGGSNDREGRVEICVNETWSTICDNGWSINDANVVCRQLGYLGMGSVAYSNARFGQGTGPIVLNNLVCGGSEQSLLDCLSDGLGNIGTCLHSDDVGVECQEECDEGDIRLRGGTNQYEGRVEICMNRVWGTVCDDFWGTPDAQVACRQLGYSEHNATAFLFARFGQGTGPIYLDDVRCQGFEDALVNCTYDSNTADCSHFEDAAVRCQPCSNGEIRLEGGSNAYQGRVEVCRNQQWGTVCDDMWSNIDAQVVCRHLGYSGFMAQAFSNAFFGQGTGPIYLDDVACDGTEIDLFDCTVVTQHNCVHAEDAGVQCNPTPVCEESSLRLQGGTFTTEGRLEICVLEAWRTICDVNFGTEDATVACKQLGFSRHNATVASLSSFGMGSGPIWATSLTCTGEEEILRDCVISTDVSSCTHSNDAAIMCSETLLCQNGDLRLVNGSAPTNGRIEICWNETWGTICDQSWSTFDGNVACRQLGFAPSGSTPRFNAFYGQGTGPLLLDDLFCTGSERRLIDCTSGGIGMTDFCRGHLDDAGLDCQERCNSGDIRFVNGQVPWEGRVEVCKDDVWGTVCDDFWSTEDAGVACRQAGYSGFNGSALPRAAFGAGTGPIHLDDLMCVGTEATLFDCPFDPTHNCAHFEDAGVRCNPMRVCEEGDIRLVGGNNEREGRVEICYNEAWGTVCDNFWTTNDANVICNQLGFSKINARARTDAFFGQGTGTIVLGDVQCRGTELNIFNCTNGGIAVYDGACAHSDDAGVTCQPKVCNDGELRVQSGTTMYEGRIEVCYNEEWGTICDNEFDTSDATVICTQLGFSRLGAIALLGAPYPQNPNAPVWLDRLQCMGNETSVLSCPQATLTDVTCPHSKDSGVRCQRKASFPSNVVATVNSNTSITVRWTGPVEFYSTIIKYRVVCNSSRSSPITRDTSNNNTLSQRFTNLVPYTNYTCCVETVYSDASENASACAAQVETEQGISAPPLNLQATPSEVRCSQVSMQWDAPPADEQNGVITMYRVQLSSEGVDSFHETLTNSLVLNNLDCCRTYQFSVQTHTVGYGVFSEARTFRTFADLTTDPIVVTVQATDATQIEVTWDTPMSIINQDLESFTVGLTSNCVNDAEPTRAQTMQRSATEDPRVTFNGLEPFVPYLIRMTAIVCSQTTSVTSQTILTQESTVVFAPEITVASRHEGDGARIEFDPSLGEANADAFEVAIYTADNNPGPDVGVNDLFFMQSLSSNNRSFNAQNLEICDSYWVIVTAVNCEARVSSEPKQIGLKDPLRSELTISLNDDETCSTWITQNTEAKLRDVERYILAALGGPCEVDSPCIAGARWTCTDDQTKAIHESTLVTNGATTSAQQLDCLSGEVQQSPSVSIGSQPYTAVSDVGPTSGPGGPTGVLPGYVWAIIAIVVVGLIIAVLLVVVVLLVRRRDKPRENRRERMLDDQDDARSAHSIGIVENPLYADQDGQGEPSYANLKEKEAEAELDEKPAYAINFDPPNDEF